MSNRFVLNNISYHGAGAIQEIPGELTRRGFSKAFVATDADLVRFGVTKKVTDLLDEAGITWEMFSDIKPNPTIENVQAGVTAFKASDADCIVAVGGGSVIDTAKAVLHTGQIGDGKLFVYDIENVVKIRTGEEGFDALQDTQ